VLLVIYIGVQLLMAKVHCMDCYKLLSDTISNLIERYVPKRNLKQKKRLLDVKIKSGHCTVLQEKILIIRDIRNVEI